MTPKISIDDQTVSLLQQAGELRVESTNGIPLVIMTVDAREELQKHVYDDSDLTPEEMSAVAVQWLNDPEGWGAPEMDVYDVRHGGDASSS